LRSGIGLAAIDRQLGGTMTRTQWLLLGAVGLAVAIVVYLIFFCPADCQ
jgi:type II secretory pathway component PulM